MADLKKFPNDLPMSAQQVGELANKFSPIDTYQNIHHREIWINNLIAYDVPMAGKPMVGGAVPLTASNGKRGLFIDESPEEKALHRWQEGAFEELEHELAGRWRESTRNVDLQQFARMFKASKPKGQGRTQTLEKLLVVVFAICNGVGGQYRLLRSVLHALEPDDNRLHEAVLERWKREGRPVVSEFVPYALYCYSVNLFFWMGIGEGLLSTRATNLIDLQYLHYLPFCKVFTSGDKFHTRIVPFFLHSEQFFVKSSTLKTDLKLIADMWDATDKSGGTVNFITHPPRGKGLVSEEIWDHCVPNWRDWADTPLPERSSEGDAETLERLRPMMEAIEAYRKQKETGS